MSERNGVRAWLFERCAAFPEFLFYESLYDDLRFMIDHLDWLSLDGHIKYADGNPVLLP